MQYVKQFGLQRSGTNAVKALLELNFKNVHVLSSFLGDKHDAASWSSMQDNFSSQKPSDFLLSDQEASVIYEMLIEKKLPLVFNVKAPASWVNSYFKYQRKKILYKNPDALVLFDLDFARRVLDRYETVVRSWVELMSDSKCFYVFVHEDVVDGIATDKLQHIARLIDGDVSEQFPLGRLAGYAKRGIDSQHGHDLINYKMNFDRSYHLDGGWKNDVPKDVMIYLLERQSQILNNLKSLGVLLADRI